MHALSAIQMPEGDRVWCRDDCIAGLGKRSYEAWIQKLRGCSGKCTSQKVYNALWPIRLRRAEVEGGNLLARVQFLKSSALEWLSKKPARMPGSTCTLVLGATGWGAEYTAWTRYETGRCWQRAGGHADLINPGACMAADQSAKHKRALGCPLSMVVSRKLEGQQ